MTGAVTLLGIWRLSQIVLAVRMPKKELLGSSFDYYIVSFQPSAHMNQLPI